MTDMEKSIYFHINFKWCLYDSHPLVKKACKFDLLRYKVIIKYGQ